MIQNRTGISTFQDKTAWEDAIQGPLPTLLCLSPCSLEGKPNTKTFLGSVILGIKDEVKENKAGKGQKQNKNALLS